jgi:hypothetical protein
MAYATQKITSTMCLYVHGETDRYAILTDRSAVFDYRWRIEKFEKSEKIETIETNHAPVAFETARRFVEQGF